jgi:hypothetical protein
MRKLFLDKNSFFSTQEKVDVIVSPALYWSRVYEIPVGSESDAKRYLPGLFEDLLPEGDYNYVCTKLKEHHFLSYAYDKKMIEQQLFESNLKPAQINGLYFAGNELKKFLPLKVDERNVLLENSDVVLKAPRFCTTECKELAEVLPKVSLSSKKMRLDNYYDILESERLFKAAVTSLALLFVILLVGIVNQYDTLRTIDEAKSAMITQYNLPPSQIQMHSIIKQHQARGESTKKIRENLAKIVNTGVRIESIELDTKQGTIIAEKDIAARLNATAQKIDAKRYKVSLRYDR